MRRTRERLADWTTFGLGGETTFWWPQSLGDVKALAERPSPPRAIGGGSNILAADDPRALPDVCTLIELVESDDLEALLQGMENDGEEPYSAEGLLGGFPEFAFDDWHPDIAAFAAIPGTLGGLWATNPRGHGIERRFREVVELGLQIGPYVVVVKLPPLDSSRGGASGGARRAGSVRKRAAAVQPPGRSAGCVWGNPPGPDASEGELEAWRLIGSAGLAGARRGGAVIAEKHANFILAEEGATSRDVLELMRMTRREVERKCGVRLEACIELWGMGP